MVSSEAVGGKASMVKVGGTGNVGSTLLGRTIHATIPNATLTAANRAART